MDNEDELRAIMRNLPEFYRTGDISGYLNHYAPDLQAFYSGTFMGFEEACKFIRELFESGGKSLNFEMGEMKIQFGENGISAVISYTWRELFLFKDGKQTDTEYYETNVWFRRKSEWKIVNVHLSTLRDYPISTFR